MKQYQAKSTYVWISRQNAQKRRTDIVMDRIQPDRDASPVNRETNDLKDL